MQFAMDNNFAAANFNPLIPMPGTALYERLEKEGCPVNVCMDCLAGEDLGNAMPFMARNGYWIVISTLAGITTEIKLRPL